MGVLNEKRCKKVFCFFRKVFCFSKKVFSFSKKIFCFFRKVFCFFRKVFCFFRKVFCFFRKVFCFFLRFFKKRFFDETISVHKRVLRTRNIPSGCMTLLKNSGSFHRKGCIPKGYFGREAPS